MNARTLVNRYVTAELEVVRCEENVAFAADALSRARQKKIEAKTALAIFVSPEERRKVIPLTDGRAILVELVQNQWDKKEEIYVSYVPLAG